jgi:hypothetical protein
MKEAREQALGLRLAIKELGVFSYQWYALSSGML